jgi:hypothetical protein
MKGSRAMEIKNKRPSYQDLRKKALKNPEIKKEYERLNPLCGRIRRKIKNRIDVEKIGIPKSTD